MNWKNTTARYGSVSIGLHWLMLLLLIAVYAVINLTDLYPKGSAPREALKTWHFMLGLTVLLLVVVRLVNRAFGSVPAVVPAPSVGQKRLAALMHLVLYALMIFMPILGWLTVSASGQPIPYFGMQLPALLAPDKALADGLKEIHETFGTVGYFLIGGHAVAALFHHFFIRDNTLVRMLPGRRGAR
jgi:cytochrome b561